MCGRVLASGVILALLATGAGAATRAPPTAASVKAVEDCRALADDAQRLACYDKAVTALQSAEASGDLMTVDRAQRQKVHRQTFGLALPSLDIFDRGDKGEGEDQITAKVTRVSQDQNGHWLLTLDDGAVWDQMDDFALSHDPRPGSTALIKKGTLGSFFIKVDGQQAFRAMRIH
jgi:hypothetical protein